MKKIILMAVAILFIFSNIAIATDADRQVTKYVSSGDRTEIKSSSGEVFGVSIMATSGNAWIAIYDSATSAIDGDEPLVEVSAATQYNSAVKDFPEGLNFYTGIYLERSNASAIVYYY